jgi:hypothetical protein
MIIIYMVIAVLLTLFCMTGLKRLTANNTTVSLLTVIILIACMALTQHYVTPYYLAETYEISLKHNDPRFNLIAKAFPAEFEKYIAEIKKSFFQYKQDEYRSIAKLTFLNLLFTKLLPSATNETIYAFYQTELEIDKKLFSLQPDLVLYLEFSDKFKTKAAPALIIALVNKPLIKRAIETKEAVIISALSTPQPPLTNADKHYALQTIHEVFEKLSVTYGHKIISDLVKQPDNPAIDAKMAALAFLSFSQLILDTGQDSTGIVYRYLGLYAGKKKLSR